MIVVGIDPGKTGAIVGLKGNGEIYFVSDMPTYTVLRNGKKKEDINNVELATVFEFEDKEFVAFIEQVAAMKGQGVSSMFAFGGAYQAAMQASASANKKQPIKVLPARWKKHFGLLKKGKDAARLLAIEKFPARKDLFARVKDQGRADAALIALYGQQISNY